MKVVLDANVFVSAAIQRGPSHRIVQAWLEGDAFELVLCPMLVGEIEDVLTRRPRLRRWISLELAEQFVDVVRLAADVVRDPVVVSAITPEAFERLLADASD